MMCLAPGDCSEKENLWLENLDNVATALRATYVQIADAFPESPVLVTAYPAPIYTKRDDSCDQVALSEKDIAFIAKFLTKLNKTVRDTAEEAGFYFLDRMEGALAKQHLQLCDPENDERPGINFIGLQSVDGIAEQRFNPKNWYHNSLHPNERGHAAMLQVFEQWWADYTDGKIDKPEATTATVGATRAQSPPDPPCDLVEDDQGVKANCEDEGQKWAKSQVTAALLWRGWWGLQVLAAALGAWLLGVALFGWWKPWWPPRPDT